MGRLALPILLVLSSVFGACSEPGSTCGPSEGVVARVIDGDTIELMSGERIRYLLVDAPETDTCWGQEAAAVNRDLVGGKSVTLTYDDEDCEDTFGRLLAYVRVADKEINVELVRGGNACYLYIPPAGRDRQVEFRTHESAAKSEGKGMWSQCASVDCD